MSPNEQYYRRMMGALGGTMLMFLLFFNAFGGVSVAIDAFLPQSTASTVVYYLVYSAGYMASFLLPILCFRGFTKRFGHVYAPINAAPRMSPYMPLILFAGVAIVLAAGHINSFFISFITPPEIPSKITELDTSNSSPYMIVLQFIMICLVPGICEEFLFRGAILTNCLPFGRSNAILISALLFSLMHQDLSKSFYTFIAGIVLGIVYEYSGSIWNCVLLHVMNNFLSLFMSVLGEYFDWNEQAWIYMLIIEAVVYLLGILSIVVLVLRFFSQKKDFRNGVFGGEHLMADHYAVVPIEPKSAVKLFFTPTMIAFCVLVLAQQILLLLLGGLLYAMVGS